MAGLSVAQADLTVFVHPSKANKVDQAVRRQLSSLLFTYSELFDGVVLAHEFSFKSKHAKILPGLVPYFGVKVKAKLLVFSPRPDMLLEGKVVKLGEESIHVIVLGFCSAAIMFEDIRQDFKYKIKHGDGTFVSLPHKRHAIKVGSMIRFLVKSVDEEILHLSGSLIPSNTGCIDWLSKHGADGGASQIDRNIKRHRDYNLNVELQDQHSRLFDEIDQSQDPSRPHKSRKRTPID